MPEVNYQGKKILIVQGSGFNWKQPDHFRVVYLPRIEVLKEAVGKISDFLSYYRQGLNDKHRRKRKIGYGFRCTGHSDELPKPSIVSAMASTID